MKKPAKKTAKKPDYAGKKRKTVKKNPARKASIAETVGHLCQLHSLQGALLNKLRKEV